MKKRNRVITVDIEGIITKFLIMHGSNYKMDKVIEKVVNYHTGRDYYYNMYLRLEEEYYYEDEANNEFIEKEKYLKKYEKLSEHLVCVVEERGIEYMIDLNNGQTWIIWEEM